MEKKKYAVTVLLRSCLTGKAVWLYRGPSEGAAKKAYQRAKKKEIERVRRWPETVARRKAAILSLLSALTAGMPAIAELPPEKKAAARQLLAIAEKAPKAGGEFYDHIMEEMRRREEDREIRRKMREREAASNRDYDKRKG